MLNRKTFAFIVLVLAQLFLLSSAKRSYIFYDMDFDYLRETVVSLSNCFNNPIQVGDKKRFNNGNELGMKRTYSVSIDEDGIINCRCEVKGFFKNLFCSSAACMIQPKDYIQKFTFPSHLNSLIQVDYVILTELSNKTFKLYNLVGECYGNQIFTYNGREISRDDYAYIHFTFKVNNNIKLHRNEEMISYLKKSYSNLENSLRDNGYQIIDSNFEDFVR